MGKVRTASVAAMVGSLLLVGATPAAAEETTPLAVTSTGLTDGSYLGLYRFLPVTWTGDAVSFEAWLNGKRISGVSAAFMTAQHGIPVRASTLLNDTDATLVIRAYDAAGNMAEKSTQVRIDTMAPALPTFDPAPATGGVPVADSPVMRGTTTITASGVSPDTIRVRLVDSRGQVLAEATAAPWTLTWDTVQKPGFNVQLSATDRAGNSAFLGGTYNADNLPPSINGIKYPVLTGKVNGVATLTADISDGTGVDRAEWWVDGSLQATGTTFTWPTAGANRTATVEIRAWDRFGQGSSRQFPVVIDNAGPTVAVLYPQNARLVRGKYFLTDIKATDPSGVASTALVGAPMIYDANGGWAVYTGKDGPQTVSWRATDLLGNVTYARRTVIVDNTRPALKVTKAPKNKAKVKGSIKVTAAAADRNKIAKVQLLINGKVVATDYRAGYAFTINTQKYGKNFKVQFRAWDKAGNWTTSTARTWRR